MTARDALARSPQPDPIRRATPLARLVGRTMVLPQENIDTDQLVPARYLVESERASWGDVLLAGWRPAAFDAAAAAGATVLVAGRNFGCGSSREHAAWALRDFGFRAVLAPRLADIFRRNALKNGVLAVEVDDRVHGALLAAPGEEVAIDLERETLTPPGGEPVRFAIDRFARHCLLAGVDELAYLLAQSERIAAFEDVCPRRSLRVPVR